MRTLMASSILTGQSLTNWSRKYAVLSTEIEDLKQTADEAAKRAARQQQLDDLEARKKLSTDIETFVARRNSLELLVKTKACIVACSVATITRPNHPHEKESSDHLASIQPAG